MPTRPNILFLLSDEHSFRFLSARSAEQGGEPCRTPTLDGLIQQGCHFDAAYCQMPLCVPSRIGLLSGRHPSRCPVLWPETPTFASHLGRHGYATATVGKMHLIGACQHAGFGARPYGDFTGPSPAHQKDPLSLTGPKDHIFMPSIIKDAGVSDIPESMLQGQIVVRESMAWLREHRYQNGNQPWLLYASFAHPHFPQLAARRFFERYYPDNVTSPRIGYTGDTVDHPMTVGVRTLGRGAYRGYRADDISDEDTMRSRAAYFACVDQLDEILGDFMAILERDGLLDNTVIVYTSDHGEMAGEHGMWWKNTWHEASARVPLIVSLPEHRNGRLASTEVSHPVSLVDMFPTLCGLTGTPQSDYPDGIDGIDLASAVRGETCETLQARPGVIIEYLNPFGGEGTEFRMIRSDRYKYVAFRGCDDLAFDLAADPDEQHNIIGSAQPDTAAALEELKDALFDNFDFDEAIQRRTQETAQFQQRYPGRVSPRTSNQILLGDGRLVEADMTIEYPEVVSENPQDDFDDWPG